MLRARYFQARYFKARFFGGPPSGGPVTGTLSLVGGNVLYIGCDRQISLTGLAAGGAYLNSATVSWTLTTAAGVAVVGGSGTLAYTSGSSGDYAGPIESTVTSLLAEGSLYLLDVTVSSGFFDDRRRLYCRAFYRGTS